MNAFPKKHYRFRRNFNQMYREVAENLWERRVEN